MSKESTGQVMRRYQEILANRYDYLYKRIRERKSMEGDASFMTNEYFMLRWIMTFIADNQALADQHLADYLSKSRK